MYRVSVWMLLTFININKLLLYLRNCFYYFLIYDTFIVNMILMLYQ